MSKTFIGPIVFGRVSHVPTNKYFFVQNGSPQNIFCNIHQGGSTLEVTRRGDIVMKDEEILLPPALDDQVVFIRESENPMDHGFTRAKMWVHADTWKKVAWATNFNKWYKAIGYKHRINDQPQEGDNREIILAKDKLIGIVMVNPYRSDGHDQLGETHVYQIGNRIHSYKVRWERLGPDGVWVKCDDPRPKHPVTF